MKHSINNEGDYLVAEAQKVTDQAREILDEARGRKDYYQEKIAAKLVEFCEAEEKYLSRYVELRVYYPELATAVEERRQHLLSIIERAKIKYAELKS